MNAKQKTVAGGIIIGLLGLTFLIFVWPTPYEYTRKYPNVVRVNRFTGVTETSSSKGWIIKQSPSTRSPEADTVESKSSSDAANAMVEAAKAAVEAGDAIVETADTVADSVEKPGE